jgi:multiple sugar transport system substrate-binding protein
MHQRSEFSEDEEKAFEAANPGITVELVEYDLQRFFAMIAAGTQLDLLRTQGPSVPQLLARNLLLDLTPYFQASQLVKVDDLAEANRMYFARSPVEIGEGSIYGMCKDWSPDFALFVNDKLFEAAGVPLMDDTKSYSWQEIYDIAKSVAKFEGNRTAVLGYGFAENWLDFIMMNALAEKGLSLYIDNFSAVDFTEEAKAIGKYFIDMEKDKLAASSINTSPNGWSGDDFTAGVLAIVQWGYWFGAMAESDNNRGKVRMLPAPSYAGDHRDPPMGATGMVMMKKTKVPDAAWKLFEYYNGGAPSVARAKSGWGVPALKSQVPLMPLETDYQKQLLRVCQSEIAVSGKTLKCNPYLAEGAFMNSWITHRDEVLNGVITYEEMIPKVEGEVNALILEGKARVSG